MNIFENSISQNRAEELGFDLWEDFVVPPFYDSLDLFAARKPRVFIGGRGCGKTCLLRYLCHQTQFSSKRPDIPLTDIKHIGIYWKIDTNFAKLLSKRGVDDSSWKSSFEHLAVLLMSQEVLKSLESIAYSSLDGFVSDDLNAFDFSILSSFYSKVPNNFIELKTFIRKEINYFQTWVGNIRLPERPVFLPKNFIVELINEIKNQNSLFKDTNYFVYIDEFENLLTDQQRLINTWIKHSEFPLIFNLAMKRYSFKDKQTIGNESIAEIHDYRVFDLESFYDTVSFEVYAAEILFLRLWKSDFTFKIPIVPEELKSTSQQILEKRRSEPYQKNVLNFARSFLPGSNLNDIALDVFSDDVLLKRLKELLSKALNDRDIDEKIDRFVINDFPQAGVIIPSLLSRKNISPSDLFDEILKLREGKDNKFTGTTDWIHNYIFGCLLLIYEPLPRFCPLYSGFDSFCLMSKSNLRHFLELCYQSIVNESRVNKAKAITSISIKSQAEASKQASTAFLKEVKSFGSYGNKLHTFVLRLGTFFSASHKRLSQSEPEQAHFAIKGTIENDLEIFLKEAVKWSVLYENQVTKQKGGSSKLEVEDFEYILNPIYAPYFHISYRKKKSPSFNVSEINTIALGNYSQFETFLNSFLKKWKISPPDAIKNLFSDITE